MGCRDQLVVFSRLVPFAVVLLVHAIFLPILVDVRNFEVEAIIALISGGDTPCSLGISATSQ
jgi:hypothetical protein